MVWPTREANDPDWSRADEAPWIRGIVMKRKLAVAASVVALVLSALGPVACTPTAVGAGAGAAAGAAGGALLSKTHRTRNAVIGAAAGGVVGGVIGRQYEINKYCPTCGGRYHRSKDFCPKCATPLQTIGAATTTPGGAVPGGAGVVPGGPPPPLAP